MVVEEGQKLPGRALPFAGECRWLISLDYDETLRQTPPAEPVPAVFFELMRSWRSLGIRWGINTGRTLPYLCQELLPASPFLPDFICTCERFVYLAGEDGVLRLEIGGSSSYVLSCLSSEAEAPAPTETAPEESTPADAPTVNKDELVDIEDVTPTEPTEETNTVAGIPVTHIVLFGGGLLVAVGALIGINFVQKRRAQSSSDNDDENDEF